VRLAVQLPPATLQAAQAAQAEQAAQLAQFLPRTNAPSPDEEDDVDDSEVRDTFMVRATVQLCSSTARGTAGQQYSLSGHSVAVHQSSTTVHAIM
jgi:hypothetical protein